MNKTELKLEKELADYKHELKLKEIEKIFENSIKIEATKHDHNKEMQRIRNADIQRSQMRR